MLVCSVGGMIVKYRRKVIDMKQKRYSKGGIVPQQSRQEKEYAGFYLTKSHLLNTLLDMNSLYFWGIWTHVMEKKAVIIKTLRNEN